MNNGNWKGSFYEKWWKDCLLIKNIEKARELAIFLMNADLKKDKSWVYFVLLNLSSTNEKDKIELLRQFFLFGRGNVSESKLKKIFPSSQVRAWKELEKKLRQLYIILH